MLVITRGYASQKCWNFIKKFGSSSATKSVGLIPKKHTGIVHQNAMATNCGLLNCMEVS